MIRVTHADSCIQVSVHAHPDKHPHTCTQVLSCPLPHPAEPDLCLAPDPHAPLSRLISGTAEEGGGGDNTDSALLLLGLHVWAISSHRLRVLWMQPRAKREKAEDPDSYLLQDLDCVFSGPGKIPIEVLKSEWL